MLTVGTDCNVGKMTAQLQLVDKLNARGVKTRFVATGQTGIFIEGWGIAVDAVVADFIAGAAEQITVQGAKDADIVLVEGQGSINHPGYSGVTLGLLHGSCPDALILCHQATREYIGDYRQAAWLKIPPLSEYVKLYEKIGSAVHPDEGGGHRAQHLRPGRRRRPARLRCRAGRDRPAVHRSGALRFRAADRCAAAGPPAIPRPPSRRLSGASVIVFAMPDFITRIAALLQVDPQVVLRRLLTIAVIWGLAWRG